MTATEFPVNIETDEEGLGTLIVTDAAVIVQPRKVPGQYPASVPHDTVHAYNILCLGNDMGRYDTHIISRFSPMGTHKLLDRVFYAFVDACCLQLWCDARVLYVVDGETVHVEEYGFEDGQYTMIFKVYCGIAEDQTEKFLATLTADQMDRFIVVRSDSSERGYAVAGFENEREDECMDCGQPESSCVCYPADDMCDGICGQSADACTCAETEVFDRNQSNPDTRGSWFVA